MPQGSGYRTCQIPPPRQAGFSRLDRIFWAPRRTGNRGRKSPVCRIPSPGRLAPGAVAAGEETLSLGPHPQRWPAAWGRIGDVSCHSAGTAERPSAARGGMRGPRRPPGRRIRRDRRACAGERKENGERNPLGKTPILLFFKGNSWQTVHSVHGTRVNRTQDGLAVENLSAEKQKVGLHGHATPDK